MGLDLRKNLVSQTSKMPGASNGQSLRSCVNSKASIKLAREAGFEPICASCYADKGFYKFHTELNDARFDWAAAAVKAGTFAQIMGEAVRRATVKTPHFRIHDSGDFFSPAHILAWADIARSLPDVRFWAPTRAYINPRFLPALLTLASLPNVTIRPSAHGFEQPPPVVPGLAAGSTASAEGWDCPASEQGNKCGSCRICWDSPTVPVTYHRH